MEPKPKERIVFDEDSYYGDDGGYSLSGEAREAALSRFALPENRKAALDVIRKLNESRDSNENAL